MENDESEVIIFNEKSLYLLNIKELRTIGRKYGVPSPTTKSKKELIDYILNIIYGKVEITPRSIFGRPPTTNEFNMDSFKEKLKNNTVLPDDFIYETNTDPVYLKKVASIGSNYELDEKIFVEKTYCYEDGKHLLKKMAFASSDDDIELTESMAKKYNLENFDVVGINIVENLINIVSINGIMLKDRFEGLMVGETELVAKLSKEIFVSSEDEQINKIENLLQNIEKNDVKVIIFAKNDYKNKNLQCIKYSEDEDKTQIYKKLMYFLGVCENNIMSGENIIVIIEKYNFVMQTIMQFEESVALRTEAKLNDFSKKITNVGNVELLFNVEDMMY